MSVLSAIRSIERAHVVVLMCDAEEGVAEQDAKILGLAEERGRAMIVALNKSDLLDKDELAKAEETAREKLSLRAVRPGRAHRAPKTGRGIGELFDDDRPRRARLLPQARRHRRAQSLLRAGPRHAPAADDGRPRAAPLLRDPGRGRAAARSSR